MSDTLVFLLNEYSIELNRAKLKILNQFFELNFPGKKIFEYFFELNFPEKMILNNPLN